MPDLLLELFSEEIPARMQAQAAKDLERLVVGALSDRGLLFEGAKVFAGPRRLVLAIAGLPARQPDVSEERKGPRVGAPEKAIEGFLRSAGVTLAECQKKDDGKGAFYVAVIARKGRPTAEVLADVLPEALARLPWPKSMRFPGSAVRWVRPLHGIVCTLDGDVVPFEFAGLTSSNTTRGHRFLSKGLIEVRRYEDYEKKLRDAHVILDAAERKEIVRNGLTQQSFALGLGWIEDEGLLDEVSGLAEWPVVLIGSIPGEFMDLPPEILQTSMRTHQKYFALRDGNAKTMANRFAVVANMVASDGGREIVAGNERVLRARLSDAKFFWDQDRHRALASRVGDLKGIVFHAGVGTQYARVWRITLLAMLLARPCGADIAQARRAGWLSKADLTTGVVGEFPELQGVMGRYYALGDDEDEAVADALRDHYRPLGAGDLPPRSPVSRAVALADKIDTLVSLWRAGEKPTGSRDPFALRRAALGIIRTILDNGLRIPLRVPATGVWLLSDSDRLGQWEDRIGGDLSDKGLIAGSAEAFEAEIRGFAWPAADEALWQEILEFVADRLKVALREKGTRHDLIDAVFGLGHDDDLVRLVARVQALQEFLASDDGANLLTAYRRAANILRIEEKKDGRSHDGDPDPDALSAPEERALFVDLATAAEMIRAEVERERFVEGMGIMARLRAPVDAFFDRVTVNDKDPKLRENRLRLLARLRATLHVVADFSKIEG